MNLQKTNGCNIGKIKNNSNQRIRDFVEVYKFLKTPKETLTIKDTKEWKELHSNEARSNTEKP
ncbi:hypothetical protein D1Z97_03150 [Riemerella anatipestifer]|nr:hypothetical protein [Riemerella anatipestifer]MRN02089.1 hypothetical protein [Riemerella anatipestifer]